MIKEKIKKSFKTAKKCHEFFQTVSLAAIMGLFIVARAQRDAKKSNKKGS
tara:strand:- start:448 stop:597 length:150 start_codon:yes stop_codon:yes gene_type:complete